MAGSVAVKFLWSIVKNCSRTGFGIYKDNAERRCSVKFFSENELNFNTSDLEKSEFYIRIRLYRWNWNVRCSVPSDNSDVDACVCSGV